MSALSDEVAQILEQPVMVFVATSFPNGSPQNTPVWIDVVDGKPVFNTAVGRWKEKNLRRDPRVSLAFTSPDDAYRYYEIRGTAELSLDGADDQIDKLAQKYIGQEKYPWRQESEQRINVIVHVDKVTGMG